MSGSNLRMVRVAALVVLWSSGFVGAEIAARADADPVTVLAWRFVLLSGILLTVFAISRRPWPSAAVWRRQVPVALVCQVAYLTLIFVGVSRGVPGGTTSLIAALQPLLVATIAGPLLGERAARAMWVGLAIGLLGVGLAVSGDLSAGSAPWWAFLLPLAGMASLGMGTVLDRRTRADEGLFETLFVQAVVTMLALMGLAAVLGRVAPAAEPGFWAAVVWLALLSSLGGYLMYVVVARADGPTTVSTLLYLTPPTTMIWMWVMWGTPVPAVGLVGLAVSAVGVGLALRSLRRNTSAPRTVTGDPARRPPAASPEPARPRSG